MKLKIFLRCSYCDKKDNINHFFLNYSIPHAILIKYIGNFKLSHNRCLSVQNTCMSVTDCIIIMPLGINIKYY